METAYSVTISKFSGNPTRPKLQGLLKVVPLIESVFLIRKLSMEEQPSKCEQLEKEVEKEVEKKEIKHKRKKKPSGFKWPLIVLVSTFCLSFAFSFGSTFLLSDAGLIVSIILLVFFLALAVVTDMIGVATTSAEIEPFNAMCARKVKGAKQGLMLIRNAEKVSSIFCDIIGDMCGILSGTVGASITLQILGKTAVTVQEVLIATMVSACIAALTVFLKAIFKKVAVKNPNKIVFTIGKILAFFKIKN